MDHSWRQMKLVSSLILGLVGPVLGLAAYQTAVVYHSVHPIILGIGVFLVWESLSAILLVLTVFSRDEAFQDQTRVLSSVLSSLREGVVVADRRGRIILANDSAAKMVGVTASELHPADWPKAFGCFLPDKETPYPANRLPLARAVNGEVTLDEEVFVRNPHVPEGIWLSTNGSPLLGPTGSVKGGVVVFRDITARKQADELSERLSNAVQQTDDTVFITDQRGRIEYVNPAFEATTGYAREEALGKTPGILRSGQHDEAYYKTLWDTILKGEVFRGTTVNRKKDGELYVAEQTITPMKDSGGRVTHFVSVVKDMTERRKRQQQEFEMHLASQVQKKFYPEGAPRLDGFDIAGAVFSAEATCGDYFDYVAMPDGALGIAIGDVSGHGFGAALVMAQTRAYLRSLAHRESNPGEILTTMNKALFDDLEKNRFVTLLLATLRSDDRQMIYANAGHTPGYVLGASGTVRTVLSGTGRPLGMFADSTYGFHKHAVLEPGEIVVLMTDGITESEAPDETYFETERALDVVHANRRKPAHQIVEALFHAARAFSQGQPQTDDITVIVCKVEA